VTILRDEGFQWRGVPVTAYKSDDGTHHGVTRSTLLGEAPGQDALAFETRYFEVEPGGWTSFERHHHPHAVVVLRGKGTLVLGDDEDRIRCHDVVYVPPDTPHQFRADRGSRLGFICVVDRERDKPVSLRRLAD
jgi:mannose-6-phosphate isomerase-like protein (cupin superfamily)